MAVISHAHRTIFLHNPKCGGVSVERALDSTFVKSWHDQKWGSLAEEHISDVPDDFIGYHVFTTWRNPYARYVSLWQFRMMRGNHPPCELHEFDPHLGEHGILGVFQQPFIQNSNEALEIGDSLEVKSLGRLELEHHNATFHRPWRSYYDPEMAHRIMMKYAIDFECIADYCGRDLRSSWEKAA